MVELEALGLVDREDPDGVGVLGGRRENSAEPDSETTSR